MDKEFYRKIKNYCIDNRLINHNMGIVTGVSGGADSVLLLLILIELRKEFDIKICAVHVNHGIRGREALRDENYVISLTKKYDIPCRVFHEDIPAMAEKSGMTEEEAGRVYRYRCFEEVRRELGYDVVAVAHHQDDQAETILFQMLRGSSLRGLGGMKPQNGRIIRPLLDTRRREIEEELLKEGVEYCTDSTNENDEYSRNKIRHGVIPFIESNIQPAAVEHLARTASQLREVTSYIDKVTSEVFEKNVKAGSGHVYVNADDICGEDIVILRELLLMMMEAVSGRRKDITSQHIESLVKLIKGDTGKRIALPYNMTAGKDYEKFWIKLNYDTHYNRGNIKENESRNVNIEGINEYITTDGILHEITFQIKKRDELPETVVKNNCTKWFDYDKIKSTLVLRHPKEGDYIWLTHQGAKKKLSRILIDCKIPVDLRKDIWVIAEESHIIWIPELGRCSAYCYVDSETKNVLCANIVDVNVAESTISVNSNNTLI